MQTLIDILLKEGKIMGAEADAFKSELRSKRITEEESLLAKLPEDVVFSAKSQFYGVPLKKIDEDYAISHDVLSHIPEEAAKLYKFIALSRLATTLWKWGWSTRKT